MVKELPEQLIVQAEFLVRDAPVNEANIRRAVSAAYYALFHLLIRDTIENWRHAEHHSRLARSFDHKRMRDASAALLKEIGDRRELDTTNSDQAVRFRLSIVAEAFVQLQQSRGRADYDIGEPFEPEEAAADVKRARLAFQSWAEVKDEPLAQQYLYSLLFRDRS